MKSKIVIIMGFITILLISLVTISCQKTELDFPAKAKASEHKVMWEENVDENTAQFRKIYIKARKLARDGDHKNAYDLFNVLDSNYNVIYDFVLFHRAEVAKEIPDEAAVIKNLKTLIEKYPESPIADLATYSLGQAYVRIKDEDNARKYFEEVTFKYPNSRYALASYYYLGEIYIKDTQYKENALKNFRQYLTEAPDGKFAANSADAIIRIEGVKSLTPEDKELIGLAYYSSGEYSKAITYLKNNFNNKTWFALGKSYLVTGNRSAAIQVFSRALNSFSGLDPDDVYEAVKATAASKGGNASAWEYCKGLFPTHADIPLYFIAQELNKAQAKTFYQKILTEFPESKYAPESSWTVLWDFYSKGNYDAVIKRGQEHVKLYPDSKSTPRVVFWVGKAYEKKGIKDKAVIVYERLLQHFPGDYYTYRAKGRLNELKNGQQDYGWATLSGGYNYTLDWDPPLPLSYLAIAKKYGNQAAELLYLGDIESFNLVTGEKMDPLLESYFSLKNGMTSKSIVVLRDSEREALKSPPGSEKGWELLYPLHFSATIKSFADKYSIDPLLVQALTREESYFNPKAISCSNAKGLMQLMPATASGVADWENLNSFSQYDLFRPEINVRLGARYLKYTHDTFSGNSMLAVAAYNGGPGSVKRWLSSINNDDWDVFVENIPYTETRDYVKKVFRSYWNYRQIYAISNSSI